MSTSTRATGLKTKTVRIRRKHIQKALLKEIAGDIRGGAVAIFPTETVYGMGTSAFSRRGIKNIYRLKGRRWNKPLQLLVPSLNAALPLVEAIPDEAFRLAKKFCPGPITFILPASPLGRMVTGGLNAIGIRVPDHSLVLSLLKAVGVPVAATSANLSGRQPATTGAQARQLFEKKVDWLIDGGACRLSRASSVIDFTRFPFTVRREGAIGRKILEKVIFA
jgi:L-threonylcarbamoyladenylate synthase